MRKLRIMLLALVMGVTLMVPTGAQAHFSGGPYHVSDARCTHSQAYANGHTYTFYGELFNHSTAYAVHLVGDWNGWLWRWRHYKCYPY